MTRKPKKHTFGQLHLKEVFDLALQEGKQEEHNKEMHAMSPSQYKYRPCLALEESNLVRVYADGIFDLFHFGRARALEQTKNLFPNTYLMVGCCGDAITLKYKDKTIMSEVKRCESLRHCKWVDEVIPDAPWVINQEFLDKHRINYVVRHALPYVDANELAKDVYAYVKKVGKFKETKRKKGVSTSDMIMRIFNKYNEYMMRNLAHGDTRKELGVSYVKEKKLRLNMGMSKLRHKVKEQKLDIVEKVEHVDQRVNGFLENFEERCHCMETTIKMQLRKGFPKPNVYLFILN